jgi:hypothetical protein
MIDDMEASMDNVDYSAPPPATYRCHRCGVGGVKLWRGYASSFVELTCVACTEIEEGRTCGLPDTDQIGFRVPAVPTEGGETYWGYTSVPDDGVAWWHRLPLGR